MKISAVATGAISVELENLEDTIAFGHHLGRLLQSDDVIALVGDLGSGKTTLVRFVAEGAKVPPDVPVNSPTFTIMNLYDGGTTPLCHLDFYRIDDPEEMEGLALNDLAAAGYAFLVEWYDRFSAVFPDALRIEFLRTGETTRLLTITASGPQARDLLGEVVRVLMR